MGKYQTLPLELAPEPKQGQVTASDTTDVSPDPGSLQDGKSNEKGKYKEDKDTEKIKDPEKVKATVSIILIYFKYSWTRIFHTES